METFQDLVVVSKRLGRVALLAYSDLIFNTKTCLFDNLINVALVIPSLHDQVDGVLHDLSSNKASGLVQNQGKVVLCA